MLFGVPRTPVTGPPGWIPRELRQQTSFGRAGPRDDVWAACRLIFFVRAPGEDLVSLSQLADSGLEEMFNGMFGRVFGPPDGRPTARDLLEYGLRRRSLAPSAADEVARLMAGRARFLEARRRSHPGVPEPPDFNQDIDWMRHLGSAPPVPVNPNPSVATSADATPAPPTARADDGTAETTRTWRRGELRRFPWRREE
jgi:hypothetical protein